MPRPKIHADATARGRALVEARREAGITRASIYLTEDQRTALATIRSAWGLTSAQAVFDRLIAEAAKKIAAKAKNAID